MNSRNFDFSELAAYLDTLPSRGGWPGNDILVMFNGEPGDILRRTFFRVLDAHDFLK